MFELSFQYFVLVIIVTVNLLVGFYVFLRNRQAETNKAFFALVMGVFLWVFGMVGLAITEDFVFNKVILFGGLAFIFNFFVFASFFPDRKKVKKNDYLFYGPFLLGLILLFPDRLIIKDTVVVEGGFLQPINGPAFPIYALILCGYVLAGVYSLIKHYISSSGFQRIKLKYFFSGVGLFMASCILFDVILPMFGIVKFNLLGPASSIILIICTAYTLVKHRLMGIKLIIKKGIICSTSLLVVLAVYVSGIYILSILFQEITHTLALFNAGVTTVLGVFGVPILKKYFEKVTDKVFFRGGYDHTKVVEELSVILNRDLDLKDLLFDISEKLKATFRLKKISFIVFDRKIAYIDDSIQENVEQDFCFNSLDKLKNNFDVIKHKEIDLILKDTDLDSEIRLALRKIKKYGETMDVGLSVLLVANNKLIGVLFLGKKSSGLSYSQDDMNIVSILGNQAVVALERARLYEEVKDYAKNLESRVERRTATVRQLQEEQRRMMLDISHELQTPLTIVKGEIEFLKQQIDDVKKIEMFEHSIDNVSKFIYDLLHYAKLDSFGGSEEKKSFNFSDLLEETVEYFTILVEQKDIKIYSQIEKNIFLEGDRKQIEELITNLFSNAMKYIDNERKIEISLNTNTNTNTNIVFEVKDTGLGIANKDISHIFDRFYRVADDGKNRGLKGFGLGLAICKKIVEKHNGRIEVESELGKGTTFRVIFKV